MSIINDSETKSKKNNQIVNNINEINFFRRTKDNYTHEDISDKKISKITSWRKSQKKFLSVLILNIITLGILHLISKFYPKLYLRLYCNNCSPKHSDFFLIEDIYGECTLCQTKIIKKKRNDLQNNSLEESTKAYLFLFSSWNLDNLNLNISNNNSQNFPNDQYLNINNSQIISFIYNSKLYEYDEIKNIVIPVYLNLKGKTNKNIINLFQEGLSSEYLVKKIRDRYGKNEYKINLNLVYIYFKKIEKKLLIYSFLCGSLEVVIQDFASTGILTTIIIMYFIFRKIVLSKLLNKYNNKDFTIDGEKNNRPKVKRKYLFNNQNDNIKRDKYKKKLKNKIEKGRKDNGSKKSNNSHNQYNYKYNYNSSFRNFDINEEENEEEIDNYEYVEIDNSELLPGDIIYLKKGDYAPCDGIILEGDCVVNEIELNETLKYSYKSFLKYTNDIFNYKNNKTNILLHGTKISNVYPKRNSIDNNEKNLYVTVLCINTGPNTYKANQITNSLDLLKRKKIYQNMYKIFSGQRLILIISISIIFFITVLIPTILLILNIKKNGLLSISGKGSSSGRGKSSMNQTSNGPPTNNGERGFAPVSNRPVTSNEVGEGDFSPQKNQSNQSMEKMNSEYLPEEAKKGIIKGLLMNYLMNFFLRAIIKSYMPIYFIISSIVLLLGLYRLYKNNIFCYEKMRILFAGEINTIFMSKINILSDDKYEIKGYYPAFQATKASNVSLQSYYKDEIKDFSSIIFSYYNNIKNNKESFIGLTNINPLNKVSGKLSVRLLECLFCCNNLIKIGHNIQGNLIEKNLFTLMKWEIKVIEEENSSIEFENYITENFIDNDNDNDNEQCGNDPDNNNRNLFYFGIDKEEKYNYNKIMDVYPQNYYKMLDKKNFGYQKLISEFKFFLSKKILKRSSTKRKNNLIDNKSLDSTTINPIIKDLSNSKCSSYKLRIYKKFLTKNSLFSSAIVYNFLLKTLRFMTKGSPEKILPHCLISSLPEDICKKISELRKDGYIIIICASKKIDLYSYNDSNNESYYLKDLIFCGLITLKNKIKKESKIAIEELKKMNCEIIMNTGDSLYNSVGTGFEIGILDDKKIYAFDFDNNKKMLYVNNIYRPFSFNYEIDEKINEIKNTFRNSSKYIIKNSSRRDISNSRNSNTNNPYYNNQSTIEKVKDFKNMKNINKEYKSRISQIPILPYNYNNNSNNDDLLFSSERAQILNRSSTLKNNENNNNTDLDKIFDKDKERNIINKKIPNKKLILSPKKINKTPLKSYISLDIKLIKKIKNSISNNNNEKIPSIENSKNNFNQILYSNDLEDDEFIKEEYIKKYFSNICYYSESLLKYLEKDSIFCISGKAFNYICNNKENNKYSNLLKILLNKTKIFFSMSSQDKSLLIDYYRELPNIKTCMVGNNTIDIDSMMTAHVGICLKKPNNLNMMLYHFYLPSQNLINIKSIIELGRVILENFFLLFISCLFCTSIIDLYMAFSFYIIMDVKPEHLRIFNIILYTLSLFGFTNSGDNNINCYLKQNNKLFWKFIIIQFIGNLIIKVYDIIIFFLLYKKNKDIEENRRDSIFITYFAILSMNQIFTTLFGFNYIRFYRKSFFDNFWFFISLMFFSFLSVIITCISRQGFKTIISPFFLFEELEEKSDTFDDRNKLVMLMIIIIDLFSTFLFITITQYYFNKKSKESLKYDKKEKD